MMNDEKVEIITKKDEINNEDERIVTESVSRKESGNVKESKPDTKVTRININTLQSGVYHQAKSQSPESKNLPSSSSKQIVEKIIFPQSKGLNMIALKNLNLGSKEIEKTKFTSQSPKVKDLKINQTSSNNNIKVNSKIPQSTKNSDANKIVLDSNKVSSKIPIKQINNAIISSNKSPPKNDLFVRLNSPKIEKK